MYDSIESKHGFSIPAAYRRMEQDGFFDLKNPGAYFEPANEPTYFWVPEAEWMRPVEILAHEPDEYEKPGFVPFAFNGAGDHWCWWPAEDPEAVVLCPHDSAIGVFDAPNFLGCLYRRFLNYALDIGSDDQARVRQLFAIWAERLEPYFPQLWITELRRLAKAEAMAWQVQKQKGFGLLDPGRLQTLLARDLHFPRLGEEFEWMV